MGGRRDGPDRADLHKTRLAPITCLPIAAVKRPKVSQMGQRASKPLGQLVLVPGLDEQPLSSRRPSSRRLAFGLILDPTGAPVVLRADWPQVRDTPLYLSW